MRYGNPDMPILGTLENEFQSSLSSKMKNLMLHFYSGFPFKFNYAKLP